MPTVVLRDNLAKISNHNIVMGMGVRKQRQPGEGRNTVVPLSVSMGKMNLTGGSLVGSTTQTKRKPIQFL